MENNTAVKPASASIIGKGKSSVVLYYGANGNLLYTHTGGTPASRQNNPGNVKYGATAIRNGALARGQRGFAIFANIEDGLRAHDAVWAQDGYQNATISEAIEDYSPPEENDVEAIKQFVAPRVGLKRAELDHIKIGTLSPKQFDDFKKAMLAKESGFRVEKGTYDIPSKVHPPEAQSQRMVHVRGHTRDGGKVQVQPYERATPGRH